MRMSDVLKNKKFALIAAAVVAAAVALVVWYADERGEDNRVRASGTVEVTEVQLAPQAGGRITDLYIKEADTVRKGDLIARLSLDGADNEVAMAEAALAGAKQRLLELENGFRKEDIERAKAEVSLRRTQYEQSLRDAKRFSSLAEEGVVSLRDAELYTEDARAKLNALNMARQSLLLLQNGSRIEDIEMAKADVRRAEERVRQARTLIGYKSFYSPSNGVILTKNYEAGDVIASGAPLATLGIMDDCWVKLYIPSTQLGLIRLGGDAEVRIDSYPDRVFKAKVTEVNQQAEYNPRLSLTQKERSNMVFWIKISVENSEGIMKPGMPADVVIL